MRSSAGFLEAERGAGQRNQLLRDSARHETAAESAAERGDLPEAARHILLALDCERRAGSMGPQVMQLIKPRS
jgi:hypothetical protein